MWIGKRMGRGMRASIERLVPKLVVKEAVFCSEVAF